MKLTMNDTMEERIFDTWNELLAETSQWVVDNLDKARELVSHGETIQFPETLGDEICKEVFTTNTPIEKEEIDVLWSLWYKEFREAYDAHFTDKNYLRLDRRFAIMCYIRDRVVHMWNAEGVDRLRGMVKLVEKQNKEKEEATYVCK